MLDKSIDGALLALRKQIIREGGDGLEHAEALLAMRGVPMPAVLPPKKPDAARRGMMRLLILDAMRKGHCTQRDLGAYVHAHRPELPESVAYRRTTRALQKMKAARVVRREAGKWVARVAINSLYESQGT